MIVAKFDDDFLGKHADRPVRLPADKVSTEKRGDEVIHNRRSPMGSAEE